MDLFENMGRERQRQDMPLSEALRPDSLAAFIGQQQLVGEGGPLRRLIENHQPLSMILWGPPGAGKTSLAGIFARACEAEFIQRSAVSAGVGDVRKIIEKAEANVRLGQRTMLFLDEIHRFNKAQQDALLHCVEKGTLFLIGATTENPSFEIIPPLLSRCRVFILTPLTFEELAELLDRGCRMLQQQRGLPVSLSEEARDMLIRCSNGDGRELLNSLDLAAKLAGAGQELLIDSALVELALQRRIPRYDKSGDAHFDTISAFIKTVRGSDPDAALHYLARMLEAGEDPLFIARRLVILASEDIGNADPMALLVATAAFQAVSYIGLPEGRLVLSQATTYLAAAEKSNASTVAIEEALRAVQENPAAPVPMHLRNAPTAFMKQAGYGKGYIYPHATADGFVAASYFPENFPAATYYRPVDRGREADILRRLRALWPERYPAAVAKSKERGKK